MDLLKLPSAWLPITAVALDLLALVLLARRRLTGRFPAFTAFLGASVLTFAILQVAKRHPSTPYVYYFYSYWTLATLNALLAFWVVYELYRRVFAEYEGVRRMWALGFRWGLVALLLLAVTMAWFAPGDSPRIVAAVLLLERSVRVVQVGLVAMLFGLTAYLRISVPMPTFGIALGFGIYATVTLATLALMGQFGYGGGGQVVALAKPLAYNCAALLWVVAMAMPVRQPRSVTLPRHDLQRWNEALVRLLQR